jgi:hypothetical protein
MMKSLKKYSTLISFLFIIIGAIGTYLTNNYELASKTISIVKDNNISTQIIYSIDNQYLFFNIFSILFINIGIALFISSFFLKYIEEDEKKNFYDKLELFQKETAKDAIHSVFNRIINDKFFAIIQKDVLNVKLIRKNAQWQYDISIRNDKPILKRTISYELHNISNENAQESINIKAVNGIHSDFKIISGKIRKLDTSEEPIIFADSTQENSNLKRIEKELELQPDETVEVVIVFEHAFHNDYIYESHSSKHPIVGLEITVNYPENYSFELYSGFSTEPRIRVNEAGKTVYVIDGAIYKGQGIEFICVKKP